MSNPRRNGENVRGLEGGGEGGSELHFWLKCGIYIWGKIFNRYKNKVNEYTSDDLGITKSVAGRGGGR